MRLHFNKHLCAGVLLVCASLLSAKTYATVDGKAITDKDMEILKQSIPNFDYAKLSEQEKDALINELINRQLILKAAKQEKLENSKEYTDIVNNIKDNLLIDLWTKKQADKIQVPSINDAQIRKIYQENEGLFINQEGKARHILVDNEAEAKNIIKELDKAAKGKVEARFIQLANEKSIDPASKQQKNGGDLGVFQRSMMNPDFSKAAFELKPGTYTKEPVHTSFGYHVIYLERKSEPKIIPYNEAKKSIENELRMQSIQGGMMQKIQELRQKAKIEITK
ncbi:peptidylprolyl isomerase [Helicobacter marmotae]|uniref:Peptidylprolyl isomerase n=1 Tax=Helicobacter marmotae TaxID=152490 RepID=A0A3D8I731_9HELI|nr:peptidylprolyl isomerase [Helicobacter marmotae]RDU60806.1 peptidylprolyl isomerase [Helicobacter marmotae]